MSTVLGVLALTIGLGLIVIAALGTQGQVFQALTLRTAPGSGPTMATTTPSTAAAGGPVTSNFI